LDFGYVIDLFLWGRFPTGQSRVLAGWKAAPLRVFSKNPFPGEVFPGKLSRRSHTSITSKLAGDVANGRDFSELSKETQPSRSIRGTIGALPSVSGHVQGAGASFGGDEASPGPATARHRQRPDAGPLAGPVADDVIRTAGPAGRIQQISCVPSAARDPD